MEQLEVSYWRVIYMNPTKPAEDGRRKYKLQIACSHASKQKQLETIVEPNSLVAKLQFPKSAKLILKLVGNNSFAETDFVLPDGQVIGHGSYKELPEVQDAPTGNFTRKYSICQGNSNNIVARLSQEHRAANRKVIILDQLKGSIDYKLAISLLGKLVMFGLLDPGYNKIQPSVPSQVASAPDISDLVFGDYLSAFQLTTDAYPTYFYVRKIARIEGPPQSDCYGLYNSFNTLLYILESNNRSKISVREPSNYNTLLFTEGLDLDSRINVYTPDNNAIGYIADHRFFDQNGNKYFFFGRLIVDATTVLQGLNNRMLPKDTPIGDFFLDRKGENLIFTSRVQLHPFGIMMLLPTLCVVASENYGIKYKPAPRVKDIQELSTILHD